MAIAWGVDSAYSHRGNGPRESADSSANSGMAVADTTNDWSISLTSNQFEDIDWQTDQPTRDGQRQSPDEGLPARGHDGGSGAASSIGGNSFEASSPSGVPPVSQPIGQPLGPAADPAIFSSSPARAILATPSGVNPNGETAPSAAVPSANSPPATPVPATTVQSPSTSLPINEPEPPLSPTVRIGFNHENLGGWTIRVDGGSDPGRGSVTAGSAVLREGNSFLVALEQSFVVPANPAPLLFIYTDLAFDTNDTKSIHDAFEASLTDASDRSLVHAFDDGRDAFFNVTEGEPTALGAGATDVGGNIHTVTLDMSGVAPGTAATVRFRLVNNDSDTTTSVRILDVFVPGINHPPTLDALADVSVPEDSGPRIVNLTGITAGVFESQALTVTATSSNPTVVPSPLVGYISPNASGSLTFTSAPNANGAAVVTVRVQDDGGTAGGGVDTFSRTFPVSVTPVNDAPSFAKGPDVTVPQDAPAQNFAAWATGISAGPADESSQHLTFTVMPDVPGLFSVPPAIDPAGRLTFTPAAGATGSSVVTVQLQDDGGTANGGVDTSTPQNFTITLLPVNTNAAPVVTASPVAQAVQYSDAAAAVTFTAADTDSPGAALSATTAWSRNGGAWQPGLPPGLTLALTGTTAHARTWSLTGRVLLAPGEYAVRLTATDDQQAAGAGTALLAVAREDARATYTGPQSLSTASPSSGIVMVRLSSTVRDISATADAAGDALPGDIRNATVTFIERDTGAVIAAGLPVGLLNPNDATTGIATFDWPVDLGTAASKVFRIGVLVGGYYHRDSAADDAVIAVARPGDGFVTGGGYLVATRPAGQLAADSGSKIDFGFTAKYLNNGRLQGELTITFRSGGRSFQAKSNELTSLAVDRATGRATLLGTATIRDVTNPLVPTTVDGLAVLHLTMVDRGEPGPNDSLAVTLSKPTGGLWLASNWGGARTVEQRLDGGNVQLHQPDLQTYTKFFVVDISPAATFRYNPAGVGTGQFAIGGVSNPRGVASNVAGDTLWVIDAASGQVIAFTSSGVRRGSWSALGLSRPEDITTDGTDVWVVDAGLGRVLRYVGAAARTTGTANPFASFVLNVDNASPTGIVTDGQTLWVTDDLRDEVFVYSVTGGLLGRWALDAENADASGITRDPSGASSDLWVVDRADTRVYRYAGASGLRSGPQAAAESFGLAASNRRPEGIADPVPSPVGSSLRVSATAPGSQFLAGADILLTGQATLTSGWTVRVHANDVSTVSGVEAAAVNIATGDLYVKSLQDPGGFSVQISRVRLDGSSSVVSTYPTLRNSDLSGIAFDPVTGGLIVADEINSIAPGRIVLIDPATMNVTTLANLSWPLNPRGNGGGQQQYAPDPDSPTILYFWDTTLQKVFRLDRTTNALTEVLALAPGTEPGDNSHPRHNDLLFDRDTGTLLLSDGALRRVLEIDPRTSPVTITTLLSGFSAAPEAIALDSSTREVFVLSGGTVFAAPRSGGPLSPVVVGLTTLPGGFTQTGDLVVGRATSGQGRALFVVSKPDDVVYEVRRITDRVANVTVNRVPVDVLDASGKHFSRVAVRPGQNAFAFTATTDMGQTATTELALEGVTPVAGSINFSSFADVSASFRGEYGRTSWHDSTEVLYSDLAIRNTGQYPADAPLLVGVRNISDPSVRVQDADGTMPDGTPYFDFSAFVTGETLSPDGVTGRRTVAFFNPNRGQFTYDLVFFGKLNEAPQITTVPDVEALAGRTYVYDVDAIDPDADALTYKLSAAPVGMMIDPGTGQITWSPTTTDAGTKAVTVRVEDGRGGSAEQRYALAAVLPPPNRPPAFTSVPVVSASVGTAYAYQATATDADGDALSFTVVSGPQGLSVNGNTGAVTWNPPAAQVGPQPVTLRVSDGLGGTATQAFIVLVEQTAGNHPPVIVSQPVTTAVVGQSYRYDMDAVDPDNDPLTYSLTAAPGGMTISPSTGVVSWTPDGTSVTSTVPFRLGSTGRDYGRTGHVDAAGNVYIVGQFLGTFDFDPGPGTTNLTDRGDQDAFVAKYDSAGRLLWARRVGGIGEDQAKGVEVDQFGNVYVMGRFRGSDDFDPGPGVYTLTSAGDPDAFIWKLDSLGNFLWAHLFGGSGQDDTGNDLEVDGSGNVYVPGHFQGTVDFDPGPGVFNLSVTGGGNDGFVCKLDSAGNLIWVRRFDDFVRGLALDPVGNVYAADDSPFVWKLTSAGTAIWMRQIGGSSNNIDVDAQANVYIGGGFAGTADFDPGPGTFTLTSAGDLDSFIMKLTTDGTFAWARRFGSAAREGGGAGVDSAGNVYFGTDLRQTSTFGPGPDSFSVSSRGQVDTLTIKLTDAGAVVWTYQFGGPGEDAGNLIGVDSAGTLYWTGYFEQTVDLDPGPAIFNLTSAGDWDTFLMALSPATALQLRAGVTVRAEDGRGGSDTQSFTIDVLGNRPPKIVSAPVTTAFVGQPHRYDVDAVDPDNDPLTYALTAAPGGMTINSSNGLVSWTPDGTPTTSTLPFRLGSTGSDLAVGFDVDAAGNLYLSGQFSDTVDFDPGPGATPLTSRGQEDAFVAKYDPAGRLLWARRVGGTTEDLAQGVKVDQFGNVYTVGRFTGSDDFDPGPGTFTLTSAGLHDIFVWKLDSAGNFVWARRAGGSGGEQANYQFRLDGSGNVYLPGHFQGTVDFDPGPGTFALSSAGGDDGFIWKLDSGGNFLWARRVGGGSEDQVLALAIDAAGNIYGAGAFNQSFDQTVDFDPGPGVFNLSGFFQAFVWKLTIAGDFVWARGLGMDGIEYSNSISVDTGGNVYIGGNFTGTTDLDPGQGTFSLTSVGGRDGYLVKLTTGGDFVWARTLSGPLDAVIGPVGAVDPEGNVYTYAGFSGTAVFGPGLGSFTVTSRGQRDDVLIKLTSTGDVVWTYQLGGPGGVAGNVWLDAKGTVYSFGTFGPTMDLDPGPGTFNLTSAGAGDIFLMALSPTGDLQRRAGVSVQVSDGRGGSDTQSFTIDILSQRILDLTVTAVDPDALTFDGQQLTVSGRISATIQNIGTQSVLNSFDVLFFEDRNDNSRYDSGVDNILGVSTVVSPLPAGASATATAVLNGTVLFVGNRIWAFADSGLVVSESDESNNLGVHFCSLTPSGAPAPDLTASYVRVAQAGQNVTYTARIGNGGSVVAPTGVNVAFYAGNPRAGGVLRGVGQTTKRLEPGQYEDLSITITGPFFSDVWVVADDGFGRTGTFEFSSFDVQGATSSVAYSVNSAGLVVGSGSFVGPVASKGFVLSGGAFSFFSIPGSVRVEPFSVNDRGQIVGTWVTGGGQFFGFLTTTAMLGTTTPIEVPGAVGSTLPYGINEAGEIVGHYGVVDRHGFLRAENGSYTTIDYPGAPFTWAYGNNDSGQIVGEWKVSNTGTIVGSHAWIRDAGGQFTSFDVPLATGTVAMDVNDAGQIVGSFQDTSGRQHGFLRDAAGVFSVLDVPGSILTGIRGISDAGQFAGQWQDGAGLFHSFVATPVGMVRECDEENNSYYVVVNGTSPPINRPPTFTSAAPTTATVGQLLRYNATATDSDGDTLNFDLVVKPVGMAVDLTTGVVVWVPTANQAGSHDVTLRVQDGRGGVALQTFTLAVGMPNTVPVITSTPTGPAVVGVVYQYQARAQDADGDPITFSLTAGPAGMSISATSGLLTWTPAASQASTQHVAVAANDGRGGATTQSFDLPVVATAPNNPPGISSTPRGSIRIGDAYLYQVVASDPNGDPLTYSLSTRPAGMTINAAGLVSWVPAAGQLGPNPVQVRVEDGRGGFATQTFTVQVLAQSSNQPPAITSTPPFAATVGRPYAYDPAGSDPDGDPLLWGLETFPAGMSIDPQRGTLRWTPTANQAGQQSVVVRALDGQGGFATQSWSITVRPVNVPPGITSTPPTTAAVGAAYVYAVAATDPDGDALTFRLTTFPAGMTVDAATGLIRWTPTTAQTGSQSVVVVADDGQGGTATQAYAVVVSATAANRPPVVTSTPPLAAAVGQSYAYRVTASDPDGDAVLFSLLQGPAGMTINPASGVVSWVPTAAQVGSRAVTVAAIDPSGNGGTQSFTVAVALANRAPTITSAPVQTVTAGLPYRYDVRATDPDGNPLTYQLDRAPAGMTIDQFGRITWAPGIPDIGTPTVAVTVLDPQTAFVTQTFNVAVLADTQAPRINLLISDNPATIGQPVAFVVLATDNVGVTALGLTINGQAVALDSLGRATLIFPTAATLAIRATATDAAGLTSVATTNLPVIDTSDVNAPVVNVTSPADGAVLTAPVNVVGTVTDANLLYYTLSVAPVGGNQFVELVRGTTAVTNGVLGRLDTATLANDTYTLRLFAVDAGGNQSFIDQTIAVQGDLKLGNFTLSFTDLTIPVSGVPITVSRTYDTLTAQSQDDLGFGWRLEFRDTDLRTSVEPTGAEEYGVYNPFRDGTRVYVTLPGGRRQGFTFRPTLAPGFAGSILGIYKPNFVPDAGVTSRLSVPNTDLRRFSDGTFEDYYGILPYNPTDPAFGGTLTLTTKDGIRYAIDGTTGDLTTVGDPNGNTLTFTDTSVVSSAGPRVTFERDPQGRITAAVDPAGQKVRYQYDARGDLVAVIDRAGNTTRFVYRTDRQHYLDQVIDPLNRTGVRTEYDALGRLVKLIDANGQTVQLVHDPANSVETVKDQFGHPTTYEYDARGNVVTEVNALNGITRRTYDTSNNLLTETDPLNRITRYTYDGAGNVLTVTDPLNNVTRTTYGVNSQVLTTTDPLGNTTTNSYDAAGNLLTTTDPLGKVTSYTYDAAGNQTSITDANGKLTRFEYDGAGRLSRQVDALNHATVYTYDANGNRLTETTTLTTPAEVRTLVTRIEYDLVGRVTKVTDAENNVTRTEYDAAGNTSATVDALGRRTEFRYDERGKLIETIFPDATPGTLLDNPRTKTEYDVAGRVTVRIDELGRRTELKYDDLDRLTETIYPDVTPATLADNPRTKTEYDAAGQVKAQIDERNNRTEFTYDDAGRQTDVKNARNETITTAYDVAGRRLSVTDPLAHTTGFTYDAAGRLTRTLYADGTTTTETYDALGRVQARTDQLNRTTRYEHDSLGRLTAVVDALNQRTEYGYDEAGNLVSQKDALGRITRYEYDGLGRRTANVLPLLQRSTTQYDGVGNVLRTTDFNGVSISFTYDERNQLLQKNYPNTSFVAFTYNLTGQRETYTDARGVTRWVYDERGRLLSRTEPVGQAISYMYDAAGNRTSVTTAAGRTQYTFDALNRIETVTDPANGITRYNYDAAGNLTRTDLPNGTFETRQYDAVNHLLFLENRNSAGVIASFGYTLAATGRRDAVVEQNGRRVDYTYDPLDRLTGEMVTDATAGNRTIGYTYDAVGNRLARTDSAEGTTGYSYDANDRLLTETLGSGLTQYTYDANGNTLSRTKSPSDRATYTWDFENRLVGADVTETAGTKRIDYRYDADGIRVSSTVPGTETRYLIDQVQPFQQVILEYRPGGLIVVAYVHGNDLISQDRGEAKSYHHVDGLGSTRALTNASGVVTDRYVYDAFGRTIGQTGTTANVYLFGGEQRDANVGLDYLRARYLNVGVGRFYGRDPIQGVKTSPMTQVPYLFAVSNPVNVTDPTGRFPLSVAILTAQLLDIIGSYHSSNPAPPMSITCGPEITRPLTAVINKLYRTWNNWTPDERRKAIDGLTSGQPVPNGISSAPTWLNAWDIVELRKIALDAGGANSVRVGSQCYYAGSVNYVLYGHMARLSGFSEPEMLTYVGLYSTVGQWMQGNPRKPNYEASRDWAIAGYEGWPFVRVQLPIGDRPFYGTGRSESYSGPEFHFNWFPNGTY